MSVPFVTTGYQRSLLKGLQDRYALAKHFGKMHLFRTLLFGYWFSWFPLAPELSEEEQKAAGDNLWEFALTYLDMFTRIRVTKFAPRVSMNLGLRPSIDFWRFPIHLQRMFIFEPLDRISVSAFVAHEAQLKIDDLIHANHVAYDNYTFWHGDEKEDMFDQNQCQEEELVSDEELEEGSDKENGVSH